MAKHYGQITDTLRAFIQAQHIFFVGTAPLDANGHVNISPKGHDSFRILSPNRVAYLDMTGSGNETSAHLLENGRITLMFRGQLRQFLHLGSTRSGPAEFHAHPLLPGQSR